MARDWVKMRTDLYRDPKVVVMADAVARGPAGRDSNVTRNVTRNAVVGALVTVWGVLRHSGKRRDDDLVVPHASLQVIDDICELPGMGDAMQLIGWVSCGASELIFPAFFREHNVDPEESKSAKNAERQKRYREKQRAKRDGKRDVTSNVTDDVTLRARGEESRGETENTHTPGESQKPQTPERCPHEQGQQQVFIPEQMRTPECLKAFEDWCDYLDSAALDVINPRYNFHQAAALWGQANKIGPEKWPACVQLSIANGYRSIVNRTEPPGASGGNRKTQPETDGDFIRAVQVCREFPSGSDYDRQKREEILGERVMRIVRKVKSSRLAEVNEFNHRAMAEEWRLTKEGL